MKALVTGVAGFVGSHLARHLLSSGDEVWGCVASARAIERDAIERQPPLSQLAGVVAWDIRRPPDEDVRRQLQAFAPDAVYHLAAISVPGACGESEPSPAALEVNVEGTRQVALWAAALTRPPRLLFTSSAHVYGPVSANDTRVSEDHPARPQRAYGKSKLLAEQALAEMSDALPWMVARAFNHSGPGQGPGLLLPDWAAQFVARQDPLEVITTDALLDLTDVRDIVRAYRLLMLEGQPGTKYNVGSGRPTQIGNLITWLEEASGHHPTVRERSPGPRHNPIADITRLVAATGWQPEVALRDTVFDFWHDLTAKAPPNEP